MTTWGSPSVASIAFRRPGTGGPWQTLGWSQMSGAAGRGQGRVISRDQGATTESLSYILMVQGKSLAGLLSINLSYDSSREKYRQHGKMHKSLVISQHRAHCCLENNFADLYSHSTCTHVCVGGHMPVGACAACVLYALSYNSRSRAPTPCPEGGHLGASVLSMIAILAGAVLNDQPFSRCSQQRRLLVHPPPLAVGLRRSRRRSAPQG